MTLLRLKLHFLRRNLSRLLFCEWLGICDEVQSHNGEEWFAFCPRCLRTHGGKP